MTNDERKAEIERLEGLLDASRDREGYADRVKAIEARLGELRDEG